MSLSPGSQAPPMGEHRAVCSAPAGLPALARRRCQKYRITRRASTTRSRSTTITLRMTLLWPGGLGNKDQPGEVRRRQASAGNSSLPKPVVWTLLLSWPGDSLRPRSLPIPPLGVFPSSSVSRFALTACCPLSGLRGPCFGTCAHRSSILPSTALGPSPSPSALG